MVSENQDGDVERPMVLDKPRQDGEFPPADSQKHEDEEIADADHQVGILWTGLIQCCCQY